MAKKDIDWATGAKLYDHTKKKHTILNEYFSKYLITRCQLPKQEKFRLVVVDGFAGAGLYECGSYGSPLIFIDVLNRTLETININRAAQGWPKIQVECLIILNDFSKPVIEQLKTNIAPLQAHTKETNKNLDIKIEYLNERFDSAYPKIKKRIAETKCGNVLFNLDQCGHSKVNIQIIKDVMQSWRRAEIFLNFPVSTILTFISPDIEKNSVQLDPLVQKEIYEFIKDGNEAISKKEWLGDVERVVFDSLKSGAPFVSPFSIHNPQGWGYWLMHFANEPKARQVYNDILHENSTAQAHFGRSGLDMLSYNPNDEQGQLYLFDENSRDLAKKALYDDIPRLIAVSGDALGVSDFHRAAYSETPAHSSDIHEMIIENPDIEVITETGGERRKANTIKDTDTLKLKNQKSWFSVFKDF
ncbi:MAG: three-Cys-motif partner protein TcmP [Alphaproteobacteria bacterium]